MRRPLLRTSVARVALVLVGVLAAVPPNSWGLGNPDYVGAFTDQPGSELEMRIIGVGDDPGKRRVELRAKRIPETCEGTTTQVSYAPQRFRFPRGHIFFDRKSGPAFAGPHGVTAGLSIIEARGVVRSDGGASGYLLSETYTDSEEGDPPNCATGRLAWIATRVDLLPDDGTTVVEPGPGALQDAIDEAEPSTVLKLTGRRYRGTVHIDKPLTITGSRGWDAPVIDGGCRGRDTLTVESTRVDLRKLAVTGAGEGASDVHYSGRAGGEVKDLDLRGDCRTAFGFEATGSPQLRLARGHGDGYREAAIHLARIADPSASVVGYRNVLLENHRGLLIEDVAADPEVEFATFYAAANELDDRSSGVVLKNADGVRIVDGKLGENNYVGISLDWASDGNVLIDNAGYVNGFADVINEGQGNCGTANAFKVIVGRALEPC